MIKPLAAVFELYILVMGVLSVLATTPIVWVASPSVYLGIVMVVGLWFTIFTIVVTSLVIVHGIANPRRKHDL
nr:MAG TPA: hypothetical protein [Caudoviricetes sp.]